MMAWAPNTLALLGAGVSAGASYPTRVGETHVIRNTSGTADVPVALPGGTAIGDVGILFVAAGNTTNVTTPSGFATADAEVERLSSTVGENVTFGILTNTFDSGEVAAGTFNVSLGSYSQAKLEVWRGVSSVAWVSSGALKATAQNVNSMALQTPTASGAAIAIAALWGGFSNEKATFAACSGWTAGGAVPQFSSNVTGRYGVQTLRREIAAAGAVPSGTITTSGTANAFLGSTTLLIYA